MRRNWKAIFWKGQKRFFWYHHQKQDLKAKPLKLTCRSCTIDFVWFIRLNKMSSQLEKIYCRKDRCAVILPVDDPRLYFLLYSVMIVQLFLINTDNRVFSKGSAESTEFPNFIFVKTGEFEPSISCVRN